MGIKFYDTGGKYWGKFDETRGLFIPSEEILADRKDELSKIIEAYSRGFKDGAEAVKAMPQTFTADGIVFAKMDEPQTERSSK